MHKGNGGRHRLIARRNADLGPNGYRRGRNDIRQEEGSIMHFAAYLASILGIGTYMVHFWWTCGATGSVLWGISGACAIFSIYAGVIAAAQAEDKVKRGMAMAAAMLGGIILLGLTFTAIFLFVPVIW